MRRQFLVNRSRVDPVCVPRSSLRSSPSLPSGQGQDGHLLASTQGADDDRPHRYRRRGPERDKGVMPAGDRGVRAAEDAPWGRARAPPRSETDRRAAGACPRERARGRDLICVRDAGRSLTPRGGERVPSAGLCRLTPSGLLGVRRRVSFTRRLRHGAGAALAATGVCSPVDD